VKIVVDEKPAYSGPIRYLLRDQLFIPTSQDVMTALRQTSQEAGAGVYTDAVSSALHLLKDADSRASRFLYQIDNRSLVQSVRMGYNAPYDFDAFYEHLVGHGAVAINGYREPAKVILECTGVLTQKDLSSFLNTPEILQLEERLRKAEITIAEYRELLPLNPSSATRGKPIVEVLRMMENDPTGERILFYMAEVMNYAFKTGEIPFPRLYGFKKGMLRHINTLLDHFT